MIDEDLKYKIGGKLQGFFPSLLLLLVVGGFSIGLYVTHSDKFFIIGGFVFTALILCLLIMTVFRAAFAKMLLGENGFYYQTRPGNGRHFEYAEITEAWESSESNSSYSYCCFKTIDGQILKFPFLNYDYDGVDYFLTQINGEEIETDDEDEY